MEPSREQMCMSGDEVDAGGVVPGSQEHKLMANKSKENLFRKISDAVPDYYDMNHEHRGLAIIINNQSFDKKLGLGDREGSKVDAERLSQLFTEMGFEPLYFENQTAEQMKKIMTSYAGLSDYHKTSDCFACAILTHGEGECVYGTDKQVEISELVQPFNAKQCPGLIEKPKLFFIQACRGNKCQEGVTVPDGVDQIDGSQEIRRIPVEADYLMAYSVAPGFYSWRNCESGSWFMQALVEVMRENWHGMELLKIMTKVCKVVAYDFESKTNIVKMNFMKQIPCITSMLTRNVVFGPKQLVKRLSGSEHVNLQQEQMGKVVTRRSSF